MSYRDEIESLIARHGVPALEAMEFFLERAAIREFEGGMSREDAETAAIGDLEVWAKLWISLNRAPTQQTFFKGGR